MANLPASRHDSIKLGEVSARMDATIDPMAAAPQRSRCAHEVWLRQARRPASSPQTLSNLAFSSKAENHLRGESKTYVAAGHITKGTSTRPPQPRQLPRGSSQDKSRQVQTSRHPHEAVERREAKALIHTMPRVCTDRSVAPSAQPAPLAHVAPRLFSELRMHEPPRSWCSGRVVVRILQWQLVAVPVLVRDVDGVWDLKGLADVSAHVRYGPLEGVDVVQHADGQCRDHLFSACEAFGWIGVGLGLGLQLGPTSRAGSQRCGHLLVDQSEGARNHVGQDEDRRGWD